MPVSVIFAIVGILLGITTLVGILGNFCVCLVVIWNRSKRNQMNILLVSLAISDIGMCASCMPFAVATVLLNIQKIGEAFCHFSGMMVTLFAVTSALTMCAISVYQYACAIKPFARMFTNLRCIVRVLCAWLIALFLALGPSISWGRYESTSNIFNCEYFHASPGAVTSYNVTLIICGYGFPLGVMTISYVALKCCKVQISQSFSTTEAKTSHLTVSCINIFIVISVFVLCRTPLVLYLIFITKYPDHSLDALAQLSFWAIYLHSACDPFIYAFKQSDYRETLVEIFGTLKFALRCVSCDKHDVTGDSER